jgi:hypothetical protein
MQFYQLHFNFKSMTCWLIIKMYLHGVTRNWEKFLGKSMNITHGRAQPIKWKQYEMNPKYTLKVIKYLDKLLDARFIYSIETTP